MSVGKASIKRAVSADKKAAPEAAKAIVKEDAVVPAPVVPAKKTAPRKSAEKPSAKAPAKKTVAKKTPAKAPAVSEKKAEPKAKVGAVALTEDMPYYLL